MLIQVRSDPVADLPRKLKALTEAVTAAKYAVDAIFANCIFARVSQRRETTAPPLPIQEFWKSLSGLPPSDVRGVHGTAPCLFGAVGSLPSAYGAFLLAPEPVLLTLFSLPFGEFRELTT